MEMEFQGSHFLPSLRSILARLAYVNQAHFAAIFNNSRVNRMIRREVGWGEREKEEDGRRNVKYRERCGKGQIRNVFP